MTYDPQEQRERLDIANAARTDPFAGIPNADDQAYTDRYKLPQLAAHQQAADATLESARAQINGGFTTPPPAPPLPSGIYHDAPPTQQWRNSMGNPAAYGTTAAADNPGAELLSAKMVAPNATPPQRVPLTSGISGESALGLPKPPITSSRLRDSDIEED